MPACFRALSPHAGLQGDALDDDGPDLFGYCGHRPRAPRTGTSMMPDGWWQGALANAQVGHRVEIADGILERQIDDVFEGIRVTSGARSDSSRHPADAEVIRGPPRCEANSRTDTTVQSSHRSASRLGADKDAVSTVRDKVGVTSDRENVEN
jgi:hypothetical protein